MKTIKPIIYAVLLVMAVAVSSLNLVITNSIFSLFALGLLVWGLVPWLYVAIITALTNHKAKLIAIVAISSTVGILGIGVMIDTLYFHTDAQGGLVFIFIPLWQLMFLVVASPLLLLFKKAHP